MYLQYGITEITINGLEVQIPKDIITSLSKRGKKSNNFKFDMSSNTISVYCTKCHQFHNAYDYEVENQVWVDTGQFNRSQERGGEKRVYFGSSCKKVSKSEKIKTDNLKEKVKTTVFIEKELFDYLSIRAACTTQSRTQLINNIIMQEREKNPLEIFFPKI